MAIPGLYIPSDWYWIVENTNPTSQVYSSASASFIPVTDAGYAAFSSVGGRATKIDTQAELIWVFNNAGYPAGAAGLSASL